MNNNLTFQERIAAYLICLMKHDETDFIRCKWNDFIIGILNRLQVDPERFFQKVFDRFLSIK